MSRYPDGIAEEHMPSRQRWAKILAWGVMAILGVFLLVALTGVLGGQRANTHRAESSAAVVHVAAPAVLRNGEFFEMRVYVEAKQPIAKPVIALDSDYWRNVTINTMLPAPTEEGFGDGVFEFTYGALEPGDILEVKIDGQINPARFGPSRGKVELLDDTVPLVSQPLQLTVLP